MPTHRRAATRWSRCCTRDGPERFAAEPILYKILSRHLEKPQRRGGEQFPARRRDADGDRLRRVERQCADSAALILRGQDTAEVSRQEKRIFGSMPMHLRNAEQSVSNSGYIMMNGSVRRSSAETTPLPHSGCSDETRTTSGSSNKGVQSKLPSRWLMMQKSAFRSSTA